MKDLMKLVSISHIPTQHNRKLCCSCKQWNPWILNQPFNYGSCHSSPWQVFFSVPAKSQLLLLQSFQILAPKFPREQKLSVKQWLWAKTERREGFPQNIIKFSFPPKTFSIEIQTFWNHSLFYIKRHTYRSSSWFLFPYQICRVIYIHIVPKIESRMSNALMGSLPLSCVQVLLSFFFIC